MPKYQFKLLRGIHGCNELEFDSNGNQVFKDPETNAKDTTQHNGWIPSKKQVIYQRGDIISTDIELDAKFGTEKFLRISGDLEALAKFQAAEEAANAADESDSVLKQIESMNVGQLRAFAETEEIDLGAARTKQELLNVITKFIKAATSADLG